MRTLSKITYKQFFGQNTNTKDGFVAVSIPYKIMPSKIYHLPDYCQLFRDFLVEELVFYESPFEFHYGKCSVIGKLSIRDNFHYLQNISLSCLDKEYCMKTGSVEILLLPTNYRSDPSDLSSFRNLVNGSFYEIHGETAFTPKHETVDLNSKAVNTMEMIVQLRHKYLQFTESAIDYEAKDISLNGDEVNGDDIERDIEEFERMHVPAIQVHTMNEIDLAEELIHTNLQLRRLRDKQKKDNY